MDGAVVYADIKLPEVSSPGRNLDSVQKPEHQLCPRWHGIMLQVGWAGNIVLVAAVIVMGVWVINKTPQDREKQVKASEWSPNTTQYSPAGCEGSKASEDFRSTLKEKLCETGDGSCHLCPMQWRLHKNKCYWFSETIQSWEKSKEDCIAKKSHLLIIDDQEEKEFIQKNGKLVWIGLIVSLPEKKWIWINGSLLQEKLFPAMQPEEGSCGALQDNEIYSELCSTQLRWICQKESVLL
ncbi:killer cell lectin-like receptor subfamily B member 1B allele C isoform X1 [Podarcis muralis]